MRLALVVVRLDPGRCAIQYSTTSVQSESAAAVTRMIAADLIRQPFATPPIDPMSREPDAAASENQDEKTQAGLHARAAADVNPRAAVVGGQARIGGAGC